MRDGSELLRPAIICEFGTVNGGEHSLLTALAQLRSRVDPTIFAPRVGRLADQLAEHCLRHVPFDVRDSEDRRRSSVEIEADLAEKLSNLRPDLVHANSLSMGRVTGRLASRLNCPCTAHLRDIIRLSRAAITDLNQNQQLFAVSAATRSFHVDQGLDPDRTFTIHNGVDTSRFRPAEDSTERMAVCTELGLPKESRLLLTIGQIGLRKGWDLLADAFAEIVSSCRDVHLLLVGERYSQKDEAVAYENQLRVTLGHPDVANRVHWLGYQDDVSALMRGVDLLIHPARQEPFGRVLLEAAATGLPIVATRVGGTSEMLTDRETARLVEPKSTAAIASAVVDLLESSELRNLLGAAARRRICAEFPIEATSQRLLAAWRDVVRS